MSETGVTARGERTRAALIQVAGLRFGQVGYDRALGADIAAAAGVSEPSIAHHFGSKRGLLIAVMDDYVERTLEAFEAVLGTQPTYAERFESVTGWLMQHYLDFGDLIDEFDHYGHPRRGHPDVAEAYRRGIRRILDAFDEQTAYLQRGGFLRDDMSIDMLLEFYFGAVRVAANRVRRGQGTRADVFRDLVEYLRHGGGAPPKDEPVPPSRLEAVESKLDELIRRLDR